MVVVVVVVVMVVVVGGMRFEKNDMYLCTKNLALAVYYNFGAFGAFFANKGFDCD